MFVQVRVLPCAGILMTSVLFLPVTAFAMSSSPAVAIERPAPARAERIGWRKGWGWGVGAGVVGGVRIGRALNAPYDEPYYPGAYFAGPAYYSDGYYPGRYRADPIIEDVEEDDVEAYCIQRFRSYDPDSGTYLGYDGLRHPCPG